MCTGRRRIDDLYRVSKVVLQAPPQPALRGLLGRMIVMVNALLLLLVLLVGIAGRHTPRTQGM